MGDGALIEFASVVGAVECAMALQRLAAERNAAVSDERRMEWRVGVHLGEVLWKQGHREQAQQVFDEVRRVDPRNAALQQTLKRLQP